MTHEELPPLVLRRDDLHVALTTLCPLDAVVLLAIVLDAHPRIGRTWTTAERLSCELGLSAARITETLGVLRDRGFVEMLPSRPPVLTIEISELLVRDASAPENLPVESRPV